MLLNRVLVYLVIIVPDCGDTDSVVEWEETHSLYKSVSVLVSIRPCHGARDTHRQRGSEREERKRCRVCVYFHFYVRGFGWLMSV